jgi:gamma-glutamyl hercynylcysteine S-oxide synthase
VRGADRAGLQDLKSWNYHVADARYRENLDSVLPIFDAKAARTVDFQTRLDAADALGQAGDPRFKEDNWVRVEGGTFWMGAQKTDRNGKNYDPEAWDDEAPVHQTEVSAFRMGRYPVTVFEYGQFVAASGYSKEQFWQAEGFGKYNRPGGWARQLRYPNRPVVEVSWYEAAAYCAWAGGRLPTEPEWECAARCGREGVVYPWGTQKPDEHRANFSGGPRHPTPVGLYPEGATPGGIEDMAGNVWEWVKDGWGKYSAKEATRDETRVIRGGSWSYNPGWLRVSNRYRLVPVGRYVYVGFRCVRELLSV